MHPTPLRVDKIAAILKAGSGSIAFPIYVAARVMGKPLNEALRAGDSSPPLLVIPTCHLSVLV
jgi:hypothetical protein